MNADLLPEWLRTPPPPPVPREQAAELARALRQSGFAAVLHETDEYPCVQVSDAPGRCVHESVYVYAAPAVPAAEDRDWVFLVSGTEPVAHVIDVSMAVIKIGPLVPRHHGDCAWCELCRYLTPADEDLEPGSGRLELEADDDR